MSAGAHVPHPRRPYPPLVINAALTGMVPQRDDTPHVPLTAEEIVADARRSFEAGATIVHLHARAPDGAPEWRREAYAEIVPAVRAACPGVVVCVSTSGRREGALARRADVLALTGDARPDMASLTLGSLNFRTEASVNAPDTIVALAERMREAGIRPELEVFEAGMAHLAADLLDRGVLAPPLYANVLLGSLGTAPATAASLAHVTEALPPDTVWAGAGIGAFQRTVNGLAVFMGGHVRTGLEDNPFLDWEARTPATNPGLVERAAALAGAAGRRVASVDETRALLGL